MTKTAFIPLLLVTLMLAVACGQSPQSSSSQQSSDSTLTTDSLLQSPFASDQSVPDSTIYGLACDGCNDTVLIYLPLPYNDSDPDTLNMLEASRQGHVYGQLRIGDKLAIIRNYQDTTVADLVISTDALQGEWCFRVLPELRKRPDGSHRQLNDSLRKLLQVEREYGFIIKPDSMVFSKGFGSAPRTSDDESDVVYPTPRRYRRWYVSNGQLLLAEAKLDSVGTLKTISIDTASFVALTTDTLVLRFADEERCYYRKTETNDSIAH